jgi:hypothetical protein
MIQRDWWLGIGVVAATLIWAHPHPVAQAPTQADRKLSVFVVAHADDHGFVEPGVPDSVRDIRSEIPKRRQLQLAPTRESADIVLRVLRRGKFSAGQGAVAIPVGPNVVALPINTDGWVVATQMEVGEYTKLIAPTVSGIGGPWKECAEQVSKELDRWVEANRDAVAARRTNN